MVGGVVVGGWPGWWVAAAVVFCTLSVLSESVLVACGMCTSGGVWKAAAQGVCKGSACATSWGVFFSVFPLAGGVVEEVCRVAVWWGCVAWWVWGAAAAAVVCVRGE